MQVSSLNCPSLHLPATAKRSGAGCLARPPVLCPPISATAPAPAAASSAPALCNSTLCSQASTSQVFTPARYSSRRGAGSTRVIAAAAPPDADAQGKELMGIPSTEEGKARLLCLHTCCCPSLVRPCLHFLCRSLLNAPAHSVLLQHCL